MNINNICAYKYLPPLYPLSNYAQLIISPPQLTTLIILYINIQIPYGQLLVNRYRK